MKTKKKASKKRAKEAVIIEVSGGLVSSVRATSNMNVYIVDYDNLGQAKTKEEIERIKEPWPIDERIKAKDAGGRVSSMVDDSAPEIPEQKGQMKSADDLINDIVAVLTGASGEYIEDIANRILAKKVKYQGDSVYTVTDK